MCARCQILKLIMIENLIIMCFSRKINSNLLQSDLINKVLPIYECQLGTANGVSVDKH